MITSEVFITNGIGRIQRCGTVPFDHRTADSLPTGPDGPAPPRHAAAPTVPGSSRG